MLISSAPYRISLFGGGTDYPDFYTKYGGFTIGFGINKKSRIIARFNPPILGYHTKLSYSRTEILNEGDVPQNNAIRACFDLLGWREKTELICLSDIPSASGLSTSSAFIVSLIQALKGLRGERICKRKLATLAIKVERGILAEPGGEQDQILSSYSGLICIRFGGSAGFEVSPLPVCSDFIDEFIRRSFLYYIGSGRKSFSIADHTDSNVDAKKQILDLSYGAYEDFLREDIDAIGLKLQKSWESKKNIKNGITNDIVDSVIYNLRAKGAIGAKLLGAGSSGFVFGILREDSVRSFKSSNRLVEFDIDYDGASIRSI